MSDQSSEIRIEQGCNANPTSVWAALGAPHQWWNEGVVLELEIGGRFQEPWKDSAGAQKMTEGVVTECMPPERLALQWSDTDWAFETLVTISIADGGGETSIVTLSHERWGDAPAHERAELVAAHRSGWAFHLKNLAACAERMAQH